MDLADKKGPVGARYDLSLRITHERDQTISAQASYSGVSCRLYESFLSKINVPYFECFSKLSASSVGLTYPSGQKATEIVLTGVDKLLSDFETSIKNENESFGNDDQLIVRKKSGTNALRLYFSESSKNGNCTITR